MIIQVEDGAALDVVQVGQGRDLVLLHSLLTDRTAFDAVVPLLMGRRRLTLVNLPGFGASDPAGPAIEDYADRLALLFPALGLDPQSTDLVAMSFGGFVGIALAVRHGHLFNRLVLVDTAAAFPEPAKAPLRGMAERALGEGMGAVVGTALGRMFTERFIDARPDVVAARGDALRRARPEHFATACRALADLDLRPALGRIRNPTLVVVGALDVTTPPALARELAQGIPHARLVELPGCAHCPPIEQPEAFAHEIGRFLDGGAPWKATLRDLGLNVAGFALIFVTIVLAGVGVRAGIEKLVEGGHQRSALVFVLVTGAVWATLFGFVRKDHLRNPDGKVLPLPAAGFLLGSAVVWVYLFASVSYVLMRLGVVEYEAAKGPQNLLFALTDSYSWHFLDLLPGVNITSALGWKAPVDLQGGVRGALLVLFRVAVIYQILAKARQIFRRDDPASPGARP